jgi:CheY-like chemotaxis protein
LHTQVWLGSGKVPAPGFRSNTVIAFESKKAKQSVLVVDDEPIIADTLCAILREHGFIANQAYSGEEALRVADEHHPDIVLTDVLMPNMSGVDMAIEIQERLPATRIVLLSGQAATAELMRRAADQGHHFELLAKPIHPEDLIARLKHPKK